jgi:hypothetical protein
MASDQKSENSKEMNEKNRQIAPCGFSANSLIVKMADLFARSSFDLPILRVLRQMLRRGFLVGCAAAAPLSSSAAGAIATHARRPLLVNVDFVSDTM